jgi:hypothetical protein
MPGAKWYYVNLVYTKGGFIMRNVSLIFKINLLLVFIATSLNAQQIKVLVEEQASDGREIGNYTIYAANDHGVNMEFKHGKQHGAMIWSKKDKITWMINYIDSTFWTMTEEDAAKTKKMRQEMESTMGGQQQEIMKLLEEQMKGMSEKERDMMKKHMPKGIDMGMGTVEEEKTVYEKTGSELIGDWGKADIYIGSLHGKQVEKVWTVDWNKVKITEADLQIFNEFQEFMGGFMGKDNKESGFKFSQMEDKQGYPGMAVRKDTYDRYGENESSEITRIVEKQKTDPSRYKLPDNQKLKKGKSPFEEMGSFKHIR